MNRKIIWAILLMLVVSLSASGIAAQENNEEGFTGEDEVINFLNNMGINGEITYETNGGNSVNPRDGEDNWCYPGERWGDERCSNFHDDWMNDYTWRFGWLLAHCEIPGYFTPENRPDECDLLLDNGVRVFVVGSSGKRGTSSISVGSSDGSSNAAPIAAFSYACVDLVCEIDGTDSSDSDGSIASYDWSIDDGFTGTDAVFNHTFAADGTYNVSLTVTDNSGGTATTSSSITVADGGSGGGSANVAPIVGFTIVCTDVNCDFDSSASNDIDGTIVGYDWDFGDGSSANTVTASHTFGYSTYTVSLTVTDDDGATGTASETITFGEPNSPPSAGFTASCTDLDCDFTDTSSDSDGSIASYSWDFGDGSGSTSANPSHTYSTGGTYSVTLTVTDDDGASDSASGSVTVSNPPANTTLVASYSCSGSDIIVTITDGDPTFKITGAGGGYSSISAGVYNIGDRPGNIKVVENGGDAEEIAFGNGLC